MASFGQFRGPDRHSLDPVVPLHSTIGPSAERFRPLDFASIDLSCGYPGERRLQLKVMYDSEAEAVTSGSGTACSSS